jgi:hypothetical protein
VQRSVDVDVGTEAVVSACQGAICGRLRISRFGETAAARGSTQCPRGLCPSGPETTAAPSLTGSTVYDRGRELPAL